MQVTKYPFDNLSDFRTTTLKSLEHALLVRHEAIKRLRCVLCIVGANAFMHRHVTTTA